MKRTTGSDAVFEDIAYRWLRSQRLRINRDFLVRELITHADYPALTSLTDFLDLGGMSYQAMESDPSNVSEFTYPVLAHVREERGVEYMMTVNSPMEFQHKEALKKGWTGIVLFPEGKPRWENEENSRQVRQKSAIAFLFALVTLLVLAGAAYLMRHQLTVLTSIWGLLSLAGLALSAATLATELGVQIRIVHEVCNSVGSRGGCDAVLKSNYARGFWGITVADMSFSYFSIQFLFFLFSAWFPPMLSVIQAIALPALAIGGYSLYLQRFKLKKWCALCLGIVAILVAEGVLSIAWSGSIFSTLAIPYLACFFVIQAILCALLVPIKGAVKNIREQLARATELQRWKRDADLFLAQWEKLPAVDTTPWEDELQFGNPDAPLRITVACQPYCGPCAHAHAVLDRLYDVYKDNLSIQVRLLCVPESQDRRTLAVEAILRSSSQIQTSDEMAHMLSDWFLFMDLEKWGQKWGVNKLIAVDDQLRRHAEWNKEAEIKGTPTIFINGRQLPKKYTLEDLFGLIPSLAGTI